MNKKIFHATAQELGLVNTDFKKSPLEYSGTLLHYPVVLSLVSTQASYVMQTNLNIYIGEIPLDRAVLDELKAEVKAKKLKAGVTAPNKNLQLTFIKMKKGTELETLNEAMTIIDDVFKRFNIAQHYTCPVCNEDNCDSLIKYEHHLVPIHQECIGSLVETHSSELEEKDANSNYLLGTLGAILGGIIATLPTIITVQVFNWEFALLYMLIPFGIIWGYQKFNGKNGAYLLLLSIVLSLVLTFALWIVITHLSLVDYYGSYITFADTWELLINSDNIGYLLRDSIFGIFSVIIGIVASLKWAMNTSAKQIKELYSASSTTLPYNGRTD